MTQDLRYHLTPAAVAELALGPDESFTALERERINEALEKIYIRRADVHEIIATLGQALLDLAPAGTKVTRTNEDGSIQECPLIDMTNDMLNDVLFMEEY